MGSEEGSSSPHKDTDPESTDDLKQRLMKTEEAYESKQKGIEAFVCNNHNDAVEFFRQAMEILHSLYDDDDATDCKIARINLHVAMRAQEIAKLLRTTDIIKLQESVAVVDLMSLTDAELTSKADESAVILHPKFQTVPQLIDFTDPVGRQMIAVVADLTSTVGCTEMEIGEFVPAKFRYMRANKMLESMREDDLMFSLILDSIKSIRDELSIIVSPENKGKPVQINNLLLMAENLKANFTTLHFFLPALVQEAGEQVQGT